MNTLAVVALICSALYGINAQGVTYTRWGRTDCPSGTMEIYQGFMAGAWYGHAGGGTNYLCMHNKPTVSSSLNSQWEGAAAWLYGVEYQLLGQYAKDNQPFSWAHNHGGNLHDNNAPCVVCYQPNRSVRIMIPGRNDCGATDLTPEYTGFLMAQYFGFAGKTEHICVDAAPEGIVGSHANEDGSLLYPVQVHQGSLSCPPYVHGNEVHCAVCTI